MHALRSVLLAAAVTAAVLSAGVAPASAAPPTCSTPPVKQLRTDTIAVFVPDCGLGFGPAAWSAIYTITDPPDHGTAEVQRDMVSRLRYLPSEGDTGNDAFSYTVTTADGTSAPVTQQISVAAGVNVAPTCTAPSPVKVRAGATRAFTVSCSDADGDPLSLSIPTVPAHGQAVLGAPTIFGRTVTVTPNADYTGPDALSIRADDGRTPTTTAVTLDVIAASANTAPTCSLDPGGPPVVRDTVTWVRTLACQDAEGDDIAIEVVTQASDGTAEGVDPAPGSFLGRGVPYTPEPGYTGPDSFTVRGRDTKGAVSGTFTVSFTVVEATSSVQPIFCATPPTVTVRAGGSKRVGGNCSASGPVGYEVLTPPQHGTVVKQAGFVYTPAAGYTGPDSFSYRVLSASGSGPTVTQPISVVAGANEQPSCGVSMRGRGVPFGDIVVRRDTDAAFDVSCYDADGDAVTVNVDDPTHGSISGFTAKAPGLWESFRGDGIYRPDPGFVGFDALRVTGSDGRGGETTAAAQFVVRGAGYNSAPSCASGGGLFPWLMIAGSEAQYEETCWDGEGDSVAMEVVAAPKHVSFVSVRADGRLPVRNALRAPAGFSGLDAFELVPVDDRGGRGGVYGRGVRVIAQPAPIDRDLGRGESVGAEETELPTPTRPASVRLQTLNEGRVKITSRNGSAPTGWSAFGLTFDITAPEAIPEAPISLRFRFDGSLRAAGEAISAIAVFRNGDAVSDCTGDGATPDPCVSSRTELHGGDFEIVVLTSRASTWSFGRAQPGTPQGNSPAGSPGGGGTPSAPPFGAGQTIAPISVVQPPLLKLPSVRLRAALTRGLPVTVTSLFAGTARGRLTLDGRAAKRLKLSKGRPVAVATGSTAVQPGKAATVTARFTRKARLALGKARTVRLTLQVAVGDGPPALRTVTLKR